MIHKPITPTPYDRIENYYYRIIDYRRLINHYPGYKSYCHGL